MFQLEALGGGRIILRDGCLRMAGHAGQEALAMFHKETGIGLDDEGYLALIDRRSGKPSGPGRRDICLGRSQRRQ